MNNVYEITKMRGLITFLNEATGFSVIDMQVKAIQNNQYTTWPGLMLALMYKHLPKSDEIVKNPSQTTTPEHKINTTKT